MLRWWAHANGITGDWWPEYRALPRKTRRTVRKAVWAGRVIDDPDLLSISHAYASWASGARASRMRLVSLALCSLLWPIGLCIARPEVATFVSMLVYVVVVCTLTVYTERKRTGKAEDAAIFTASTLRRLDDRV